MRGPRGSASAGLRHRPPLVRRGARRTPGVPGPDLPPPTATWPLPAPVLADFARAPDLLSDLVDHVLNRLDVHEGGVRQGDVELPLEGKGELNGIDRIHTEIFGELGGRRHGFRRDAQAFGDHGHDSICYGPVLSHL